MTDGKRRATASLRGVACVTQARDGDEVPHPTPSIYAIRHIFHRPLQRLTRINSGI